MDMAGALGRCGCGGGQWGGAVSCAPHAVELSCRGGRRDGGSAGSVRTQQLPARRLQPKIPFRFRCVIEFIDLDGSKLLQY